MHVKDTSVFEMNELMLTPALDRTYSRTGKGTQCAARQPSTQRRVQRARAEQRPSFDRRAQKSRGAFDLGKLRHELSLDD